MSNSGRWLRSHGPLNVQVDTQASQSSGSRDDPRAHLPGETNANRNLRQVIEYLSKKGYSRTEAMLRVESAAQANSDDHALNTAAKAATKFTDAMRKTSISFKLTDELTRVTALLERITENVLDIYKVR